MIKQKDKIIINNNYPRMNLIFIQFLKRIKKMTIKYNNYSLKWIYNNIKSPKKILN
jgi:hypothetical protein